MSEQLSPKQHANLGIYRKTVQRYFKEFQEDDGTNPKRDDTNNDNR